MLEKKNGAVVLLLSLITCGIYMVVWMITSTNRINERANKPNEMSGGVNFLLMIVTCGIWQFFWLYKNSKKLYEIQLEQGNSMAKDNSVMVLILLILGAFFAYVGFFLAIVILQDQINSIVDYDMMNKTSNE